MGLDMYLYRRVYVCNMEFDEAGQALTKAIAETLGLDYAALSTDSGGYYMFPAAYWRKANAIHGWFVNNVQEGDDDCREYDVGRGQLVELRNLCDAILAGKEPKTSMPPQAGFFFGSTDDDEYYREDLRNTVKQLDKILNTTESKGHYGDDFVYRSSW